MSGKEVGPRTKDQGLGTRNQEPPFCNLLPLSMCAGKIMWFMSLNHKTNFFPTPPMCVCVCVCSDSLFFSFLLRFCLFALFLSRRCLYKNIYSMSSFGCDAMWCSNARQPAFAWATGSGLDEEAGNIHLGDSMPVEWSNGPGLCVPLWMWICMSGLQLDWSKVFGFGSAKVWNLVYK